jgi:hypothetical protein
MLIDRRISSKYHAIAADSQLWKSLYYRDFVRPKTVSLPGFSLKKDVSQRKLYASKVLKHLQPESAIWRENETNWKNHYKLQQNWTNGACEVREFQVAKERPIPPLLVRMHAKVIYTADSVTGLRAWTGIKSERILGFMSLKNYPPPTSLAIDTSLEHGKEQQLILGFNDGSFAIFSFVKSSGIFKLIYKHEPSSNGTVIGVGLCGTFVLTMTARQILSIYKFSTDLHTPPLLLHSLQSHSTRCPLSYDIRRTGSVVNSTVAYVFHGAFTWMVGVQELRMDGITGDLISSRTAQSAPPSMTNYQPFMAARYASTPTALSYTHPYLLLTHPDNTLTLFMVSSTKEKLQITPGTRLWGHTSAVSGVQVESRGKAVSVSLRGDEVRIWQLEETARGNREPRWWENGKSVQVNTKADNDKQHPFPSRAVKESINRGSPWLRGRLPLGLDAFSASPPLNAEDEHIRPWVGLDDEAVVVLKERLIGQQYLRVYDFS